MATNTKVAQISVVDASNRTRTFKIDNPKENLTFRDVQQALAPAFQGGWWYYGPAAERYTTLAKVVIATSSQIQLDRGEFSYSPTSLVMPRTYSNDSTSSQSISFSGAIPQNVSISIPQFQFSSITFFATLNADENTIIVTAANHTASQQTLPESATSNSLIMTVEGINIEVPITFQ